jgi:hypothetical protein
MAPTATFWHSALVRDPVRQTGRPGRSYHLLDNSYGISRKPGSQGATGHECALLAVVFIVFLALLAVLADVVSIMCLHAVAPAPGTPSPWGQQRPDRDRQS